MSDINEILNNPEGQSFSLDPGMAIKEVIQTLETLHSYNVAILKNQNRILQLLETGKVDEDKAEVDLEQLFDRLGEEAHQNFLESIARIASARKS